MRSSSLAVAQPAISVFVREQPKHVSSSGERTHVPLQGELTACVEFAGEHTPSVTSSGGSAAERWGSAMEAFTR